jgi:hypothetical protein
MKVARLFAVGALVLAASAANAVTYVFEAFSSFDRGSPEVPLNYTGGFEVTVDNPITVNTVLPLASLTSCTVFANVGNPVCTDQEFLFGFSPGTMTIAHSFSNAEAEDAGANYYYFDLAAAATNGVWDTVFFGTEQQGRLTVTGVVPEPGTWAMLVSGLGLVAVALRRRKVVAATA